MFVHVVLFWLHDTSLQPSLLEDCQRLLAPIPSLKHISFGRPAMTPRDVVDNTYTVGLCTIFNDKPGHDAYQAHPLHKEFAHKWKSHWSKIVVYDFE
jgi:hypothetical protein